MADFATFKFGVQYLRKHGGWQGCVIVSKHYAVLVGHIPDLPYLIADNSNTA